MNARADGIDLLYDYARIATSISRRFGFANHCRYAVASAECLPYPDANFDCCWSHGVLMYTDIEAAISEVARVLVPDGAFYCGYSAIGTQVRQLTRAIICGDVKRFRAHARIIFASTLRSCGIFHAPGSRISMISIESLLNICRTFGMDLEARPGVQDRSGAFLGLPSTFDFLVQKRSAAHDAQRQLAGHPSDWRWLAAMGQLAADGCPRFVCKILELHRAELSQNTEFRSVYLQALVRSGQSAAPDAVRLVEEFSASLEPHQLGLYWLDRKRAIRAGRHFKMMSPNHADREFLIAASQLAAGDFRGAIAKFSSMSVHQPDSVRTRVGLALAKLEHGDTIGGLSAIRDFLAGRGQFGADPQECESIVAEIDTSFSTFYS
jgi:hypothetical protein